MRLRRSVSIPRTAAFCLTLALAGPLAGDPLHYPTSRRVEQTDVYHGVTVADPYRWLEADVRQSPEVRQWVDAQNKLSSAWLAAVPERTAIHKRLDELWRYERRTVPEKKGGRYFFFGNDGRQNLEVLYVQDSLLQEPRVLLDPNPWSPDGSVSVEDFEPSPDGRYVAYAVSEAGSDWQTWRVLKADTGQLLPDVLKWIKLCCAAWTADGKGFFYPRLPPPAEGTEYQVTMRDQKIYYHRLGTLQSADPLVWEAPEQTDQIAFPEVTEDGRYLLLYLWSKGRLVRILLRDLSEPYGTFQALIPSFDNQYFNLVGNDGPVLYFQTDFEAPRGRVIAIDLREPGRESWREVIPQSDLALSGAGVVGNSLVAQYLRDAVAWVRIFTLDGRHLRDLELPGSGSGRDFTGSREDTELLYRFSSFNRPNTLYRYDLVAGATNVLYQPKMSFDPEAFEVKQVFATSKDGTRVPLFLGYRKGLKLDGSNPAILHGYGGFNSVQSPGFNPQWLAWMERGGVVALACLRGGGEYGEEWHRAGTRLHKQNTFDDFIAAAEKLIADGYTRSSRLAITGASNGGLLVGAAMTQRPDLFGATVPQVGVMDMLRYHQFTVGSFWVDDYGSADNPEEFKALYAYSPYHNLKEGAKYPPTLVVASDTDDRVVPGHSFKFAARLQHDQAGEAPVLVRIQSRGGHGGAPALSEQIEESTDILSFLVKTLGQ